MAGGLRRTAGWALSPFAWGSAVAAGHGRLRVLDGPFEGMRYPAGFVPAKLFAGPYQLGSFESELHWQLEWAIDAAPATVVNVGSAEGYYAVGLALRLPGARVIAYEQDPALREACARLASINGVADRVELRGLCTVDDLAGLEATVGDGGAFVLMDCEGGERELADPAAVSWLAEATLLIELHEVAAPGIAGLLASRFAETHELSEIESEVRRASAFERALGPIPALRRIDRELLVAEFRDGPQRWMFGKPVAAGQPG